MADSVEVSNFFFHSCRKFRIFSNQSKNFSRRTRLAVSSNLGVTFAVTSENRIVCFSTKSLLDYKLSKENMNVEVDNLKVKEINFGAIEVINTIGVNSDGTLLGILHTSKNNVFVEIHDIKTICSSLNASNIPPFCKIRIGTEPSNQGSDFEWNPAFPDTFAATSSDRSVVVMKIDRNAANKQTVVGSAKMGSVGGIISWSPKGKQLTIGDMCGKVIQLKPELEIVRSIMPPNHSPSYHSVTGLCWLATTEWIVSYAKDENSLDHETYLMKCKKDKPTEWIPLSELSYSNPKSLLPANLLNATQILVDWNVVLVANTKTSQVVPVGKIDSNWQTWTVDEGKEVYLPTTSNRNDSFPIGICVDRSMKTEVQIGFDGLGKKHAASPLLICLTNDGVITAHHIITSNPAHANCQITSQDVAINGTKEVQSSAVAQTPKTVTVPSVQTSPAVSQASTPAALPISSKAVTTSVATPKQLFGVEPKVAPTAVPTPAVSLPPTTTQSQKSSLISTPAAPQVTKEVLQTPKAVPVDKEKVKKLKESKKKMMDYMEELNLSMREFKDQITKLTIGTQNVKKSVTECSQVVKASIEDSREVLDEMSVLIKSIEEVSERTRHTVKEMDFEMEEKMEYISQLQDSEKVLETLRDISESEKLVKFNKLEVSADLLSGRFVECNEMMKKIKHALSEAESLKKHTVLSPLRPNSELNRYGTGKEIEVALQVMRNVSKIIMDVREKLQRNELDLVALRRKQRNALFSNQSSSSKSTTKPVVSFQCPPIEQKDANKSNNKTLTNEEIIRARQALISKLRAKGVPKTRKVNIETYKPVEVKEKKSSDAMDTHNLSQAIMKLSMTPRKVMTTSSLFAKSTISADKTNTRNATSDATTQSDQLPEKIVVVTVESRTRKSETETSSIATTANSECSTNTSSSVSPDDKSNSINAAQSSAPLFSLGEKTSLPQTPKSAAVPQKTDKTKIPPASIFGTTTANTEKPSLFGSTSKPSSLFELPKVTSPTVEKDKKEETKEAKIEEETLKIEELSENQEQKSEDQENKEKKKVSETVETSATPKVSEQEEEKSGAAVEVAPNVPVVTAEPVVTEPAVENANARAASFSFSKDASSTPQPTAINSSIFGGKVSTPASSMFGGGVKTSSTSPFGNFGQSAQVNAQPAQPVSFSFTSPKPATSVPPATSGGFGNFGSSATAAKPTGFAAAAAAAAMQDDGMEDDSMPTSNAPTSAVSPFGGGFMSSLGTSSSNNANTSTSNIFGNKPTGTPSSSSNSWLFSGNSNQAANSNQASKPTFSFATAAAQHAQQTSSPTSSFGAAPKFGGQPAFGAKPFGGGVASGGGALSKDSSIFGSNTSGSTPGSGFAQFSTGGTSTVFGGGATQAPSGSSLFGGSSKPAGSTENSIFGGSKPNSTFGSWR